MSRDVMCLLLSSRSLPLPVIVRPENEIPVTDCEAVCVSPISHQVNVYAGLYHCSVAAAAHLPKSGILTGMEYKLRNYLYVMFIL